jgi:hypothetical protein
MTTSATASADDDSPTSCENKSFDNIYYLIDKNDFYSASIFFQKIEVIDSEKETKYESLIGEKDSSSIYYDFDDFALLKENKELVYNLEKDLLKFFPEREEIIFIDKQSSPEIINNFEIKIYKKKISALDKHPLFSRIKRIQRPILIDLLTNISNSLPESISESLKIEFTDNVHFITLYRLNYGAITLSRFSISNYGVANTSLLFKIEKFYNKQIDVMDHEEKYLDAFFCHVEEKFIAQFPHIKSKSWFGYRHYNQIANDNLPTRELFRKYPEIYSIGQIIILIFIGFLFIYLVLGRYSKSDSYRNTSKFNQH